MNRTGWLIAAFALIVAVRLIVAWQLPVTDDEAYYWTWSQHLQWGYPDHPPLIAGLIRLTTGAFGDSPLAIRVGPLLFTLATGVPTFAVARDLFGVSAGVVAAFTSQLLPVVAAGGALAVPDAPFVFFWMLVLWLVWRARGGGEPMVWLAAGAALGLAIMSKLFAGFLLLGLTGFLLTSREDRRWLRTPFPYAAAVIAALIVSPFLWWNAAEGWPSWMKITRQVPWILHGGAWDNAMTYLAAQFVYYGPLTAPVLVLALRESVRPPKVGDARFSFLAWSALPLLVLPFVFSPAGLAKPHWPAPAYLTAAVVTAGTWWMSASVRRRRFLQSALGLNGLLLAVPLVLLWVAPAALVQTQGWNQVADRVDALARDLPAQPGVFVFSAGYQTASQLTYRLRDRYPVTAASAETAFAQILPLRNYVHWNAIFVEDDRAPIDIPIQHMFADVRQMPPIPVTLGGRVVRTFTVYRGLDFTGLDPWARK